MTRTGQSPFPHDQRPECHQWAGFPTATTPTQTAAGWLPQVGST
jgi:hypothetical protein